MNTVTNSEWLSLKDVQQLLGIGRTKAYELVATGELPAVRIGRSIRINKGELDEWIQNRRYADLIRRDVADSVKPPQLKRTEMKPLSPKQAKALLEAAGGDRFEAMYVLAITAGLRQGELLGLKWEDVDLEGGKLRVRRTLYKGNFTTPKTAKSRRTVKLTVRAVEALQRHREAQLEESEKVEGLWQDHGLIFTTQVGTPVNRHNFYARNFKPLLKKGGLPHTVRFHDLRHTCATLLLSKNVNPKVVSEMLGHANVTVTLDTYSHVLPYMQDGAVDAMDSSLS